MMKEAPFEVWLGNLRKYTEGDLEGKWISFPQGESELQEMVRKIAGPDNDELMIMDISTREDCGYMREIIGEWSKVDELNTVAKLIGDEPHPAVEAYLQANIVSLQELANLFMQESEIAYFPYDFDGSDNPEVMNMLSAEEKMGYTYIERFPGLQSELENLQINETSIMSYLDVGAIGRDLSFSGSYLTDHGYYDERMKAPNLSLYTMDQIKEELAQQEQQARQEEQAQQEQKEQQEKETAVHKEQRQKPPLSPSM